MFKSFSLKKLTSWTLPILLLGYSGYRFWHYRQEKNFLKLDNQVALPTYPPEPSSDADILAAPLAKVEAARKSATSNAASPQGWTYLAQVAFDNRDYLTTISALQTLQKLKTSLTPSQKLQLGFSMKECGLARTALPLLQEVQPILSRNALAYVTLCQAFSKMGQNDKALEVLNQGARNIEITDIQGRILISQEYRMFAEWDKSQEQMQEAYAQAPNDANLGAMVGSAMIDSNKIDESRSFLAELVSKFPQSSEAHRQYAYALYDFNLKGNNLKQAEHHFLTAVRLDPQNRQAWRQLGEMYQRTHRVRPTAYAFTHALQLNPHDGDARMTVSRSYGLLGLDMEPVMSWQNRRRFAIRDQTEYFMRTMRYQNPNDPNSLLMLPRHYAKYGQYEKCFHAIQSLYIPYGTMPAVREEVEKLYREIKLPFPLLPTPLKDKGSVLRTPSGFQG